MKITFDGIKTNFSFDLGKVEIDCSPEEVKTLSESEVEKTKIVETSDNAGAKMLDAMMSNMMSEMRHSIQNYLREEFAKRDTVITSNSPNQCTRSVKDVIKTDNKKSTKNTVAENDNDKW